MQSAPANSPSPAHAHQPFSFLLCCLQVPWPFSTLHPKVLLILFRLSCSPTEPG